MASASIGGWEEAFYVARVEIKKHLSSSFHPQLRNAEFASFPHLGPFFDFSLSLSLVIVRHFPILAPRRPVAVTSLQTIEIHVQGQWSIYMASFLKSSCSLTCSRIFFFFPFFRLRNYVRRREKGGIFSSEKNLSLNFLFTFKLRFFFLD